MRWGPPPRLPPPGRGQQAGPGPRAVCRGSRDLRASSRGRTRANSRGRVRAPRGGRAPAPRWPRRCRTSRSGRRPGSPLSPRLGVRCSRGSKAQVEAGTQAHDTGAASGPRRPGRCPPRQERSLPGAQGEGPRPGRGGGWARVPGNARLPLHVPTLKQLQAGQARRASGSPPCASAPSADALPSPVPGRAGPARQPARGSSAAISRAKAPPTGHTRRRGDPPRSPPSRGRGPAPAQPDRRRPRRWAWEKRAQPKPAPVRSHLVCVAKVSASPASPTPLSDPPLALWAEAGGDKGATSTPQKRNHACF